ncbi:MAG TPA: endonuclease III [Chthoniobacterales bacterium]|jgi:endonuclease-3
MTRSQRAALLVERLPQIYPDAHCELRFSNPLELLIATILSAQCTDVQVNKVTPALFAAFPTAADYAAASQEAVEHYVKSTNFFRNKAKSIRSAARDILDKHGGEVPRTLGELVTLAGVGRKTANVVLGNAFGLDEGIVVDTHVARLSSRLKLTTKKDAEKIESDLVRLIPRPHWTVFPHWLISHGRRICTARSPKCSQCELADLCPSAGKVPGAV